MKYTAKTLFGLEDLAVAELAALGATNLSKGNRVVYFEGDQALLYTANLCARSILRILVPISSFTAHNDRHFYQLCKKVNWEKYMGLEQSFAINSTTFSERFRHSQYASLKLKDAIVDQFRENTGKRPSVNTTDPDVLINLHISETEVTLSLDSSGTSLEKRGYRTESNDAPMSEALAAAMLLLSGWDGKEPMLDAMCGSGTIAIEAALLASNTPPGLFRSFGFQRWQDYDQGLFSRIEFKLRSDIVPCQAKIVARDIDPTALSIAKRNAQRAGVIASIHFEVQDFLTSLPVSENGWIFMNPPYGERLEDDEAMPQFYHEIGFRLKHFYPNHRLWLISGNLPALKRIGLKPRQRLKVFNGPIECRLNGYELFRGKLENQTDGN